MTDDAPDIPDHLIADQWDSSKSPSEILQDMRQLEEWVEDCIDQVATTARKETPPDRYRSPAKKHKEMMLSIFDGMAQNAVDEGIVEPGDTVWIVARFDYEKSGAGTRELCAEGTVYAEKPLNVDPRAEIAKVTAPSPSDGDSSDHDANRHPDD